MPLSGWRYGLHPRASGMQVRSLTRVELLLGEALRLELAPPDGQGDDEAHLQYYIVTHAGPWALWLSCPQDELAARESALRDLKPPFDTQT